MFIPILESIEFEIENVFNNRVSKYITHKLSELKEQIK